MYADAMAFLAGPGKPPIAHPRLSTFLTYGLVTAAPPSPQFRLTEQILDYVHDFKGQIRSQSHLQIIETSGDLHRVITGLHTGLVLGLQQAPYDVSEDNLKRLFEAGIRVIGTSYQGQPNGDDHPLGGGFLDPEKRLTQLGRRFLGWCNDLGLIVDLAHAGHATARDIVHYADRMSFPGLMVSHTGSHTVCHRLRNLPDDVLLAVMARNGIVGIYTLTFGLSADDDTWHPMVRHLNHLAKIGGGSEHLCVGTDGVYQSLDKEEWRTHFNRMKPVFDPTGQQGARWPDQPFELNEVSRLERLQSLITNEGWEGDARDLDGVLGLNLFRFFRHNLPL